MSFSEKIAQARKSKSFMIWLLVALILLIIWLYFFGGMNKTQKNILLWTGIIAAWALWLEVFDYDLDLTTLWKTWSIQDSRVQKSKWVTLIGDCITDDAAKDLNCDNFATQAQAQAQYQKCVDRIKTYNNNLTEWAVLKLDVYWLDGDKDGIVCEHLPAI